MPTLIFNANASELAVFEKHQASPESIKNLMFDLSHKNDILDEDGKVIPKAEAEKTLLGFSRDFVGFPEMPAKISPRDMKRSFKEGRMQRFFELIEEVVDDTLDVGYRESEWFNELVDYRNVAAGDAIEFWNEDDNLILDIAVVGKSHHDYILQRPRANAPYTLQYVRYGAAVGIDLNRYFAGQESFDKLISALVKSIMVKNQGIIFGALGDAVSKLPVTNGFIGSGALVKTQFDTIIENVEALYGSSVVIGTKTALRSITGIALVNWADAKSKEDVMSMGRLGSYEGTLLVEVPQRFKDKTLTTKVMDDKKLYILPSADYKLINFVTRGETEIDEILDKGEAAGRIDDIGKYEIQYEQGIGVKANKQFGVWTLP